MKTHRLAVSAFAALAAVAAAGGGAGSPGSDDFPSACRKPEIVKSGKEFGVGGKDSSYADGTTKCWKLSASEHLTIVFTFFETEFTRDTLTIIDGDDAGRKVLSGELVAPHVVRSETREVYLYFQADGTFHGKDSASQQLGFVATYFDSSDGSCANDCSGFRGDCDDGVCNCIPDYGGGDCSVDTVTMGDGDTVDINRLPVGGWIYGSFTFPRDASYVVEVRDTGPADSEPRLIVGKNDLPSRSVYDSTDWFASFYDFSDYHYVRGSAKQGETLYVGVLNDEARAKSAAKFTIKVELGEPDKILCLFDCNGQGSCDERTGDCVCDQGYAGAVADRPDTCQFEIEDLDEGKDYESSVRIGNWDFYRFDASDMAPGASLLVEFYSSTPSSLPLLVARRGDVPRLLDGWLPDLDTFVYDLTDADGFTNVRGQRMSILLNDTMIAGGSSKDWYFGVYNLWGHVDETLDETQTSQDTCDYTLRTKVYHAGVPCPSTKKGFCDLRGTCDFNTGECACNKDRLWRDCSFKAPALAPGQSRSSTIAGAGDAQYFSVAIDQQTLQSKKNLVVTLGVEERRRALRGDPAEASEVDAARPNAPRRLADATGVEPRRLADAAPRPELRANFGDVPFPGALSSHHDDALLANYYGDAQQRVLLDAEELAAAGPGVWYFGVVGDRSGSGAFTFSIEAELPTTVACPRDRNSGKTCNGNGVCKRDLGRCDCDDGSTRDDCGADGPFPLDERGMDFHPPIQPDDWAYYSFVVGCEDRLIDASLYTNIDGGTDVGAKPRLFLRRERLPLMVVDSYDFLDFYGPENEDQRIVVTSCDDEFYRCPTESTGGTGCCAKPAYPGTAFASGAGAPGIWYVGVYNDKSATATLESYKVSVQIKSTDAKDRDGMCDTCAEGFQWPPGPHDGDQCGLACPGRAPTDVYSNSPALNLFGACSGRGTCKSGNIGNGAYCECDAGAAGAACEVTCPADADGLACSGHGTCRFNDPKNAQNHDDVDDPGRAGSPGATCECEPGRTGAMCEYECPVDKHGEACSGAGRCVVRHDAGPGEHGACDCDAGLFGDTCALSCPADKSGHACSGVGACVLMADGKSVACMCDAGFTGKNCDKVDDGNDDELPRQSKGAGILVVLFIIILMAGATTATVIAVRRQNKIANYERVLAEVGHADAIADYISPENEVEMKSTSANGSSANPMRDSEDPGGI